MILFKYPVPLGATGLIVDLSLNVYADGDIKSSGKIEARLSQRTQITLGAKQAKNGNMEWVRNTTKEQPEFVSSIETEFKANAEAGRGILHCLNFLFVFFLLCLYEVLSVV